YAGLKACATQRQFRVRVFASKKALWMTTIGKSVYFVGSLMCSWTIFQAPSRFSQTEVHRQSTLLLVPSFICMSMCTIAVAQLVEPAGWIFTSSTFALPDLIPASTAFTPDSYSAQLWYSSGAISK